MGDEGRKGRKGELGKGKEKGGDGRGKGMEGQWTRRIWKKAD